MDIRVKIKISAPRPHDQFLILHSSFTPPSAWFFIEHEVRFFSETQ